MGTNTKLGDNALPGTDNDGANTAIGCDVARYLKRTTGSPLQRGAGNTMGGYGSASSPLASFDYCTSWGMHALKDNVSGYCNSGFGIRTLAACTTGKYNFAGGADAGMSIVTADQATCTGAKAGLYTTTGNNLTANGTSAAQSNVSGNDITAVGALALWKATAGMATAVGAFACANLSTGVQASVVGRYGAYYASTASEISSIGDWGLSNVTTESNVSGIGHNTQVSGSNQVQLGNSYQTVYAQSAVQTRSDARDKTDIQDTKLGLKFIMALRPVDFRWDKRDDYRTKPPVPSSMLQPHAPMVPERAAYKSKLAFKAAQAKYADDLRTYEAEKSTYDGLMREFEREKDAWLESNKLGNITKDGSKKRSRLHHGLIAQEVAAVMAAQERDFGGLQDHTKAGGDDVLTVGYEELIAPLIRAVQELAAENKTLRGRVEDLYAQLGLTIHPKPRQ